MPAIAHIIEKTVIEQRADGSWVTWSEWTDLQHPSTLWGTLPSTCVDRIHAFQVADAAINRSLTDGYFGIKPMRLGTPTSHVVATIWKGHGDTITSPGFLLIEDAYEWLDATARDLQNAEAVMADGKPS